MNITQWRILLTLGLFFGWMLSFPFSGPLLYTFETYSQYEGIPMGITFMFFHAAGFFVAGYFVKKEENWKRMLVTSGCATFLFAVVLPFSTKAVIPVIFGLMGLSAAVFIISWSVPYTYALLVPKRTSFMAGVIITAVSFVYIASMLSHVLPFGIFYVIVSLPLAAALWVSYRLDCDCCPRREREGNNRRIPVVLMSILGVLILQVYFNGGLMYNVMYPSFREYEGIAVFFRQVPYVAAIASMWVFGHRLDRMMPLYIGTTFLGFSFMSFALLDNSVFSYLATEFLIQAAFGFLDLFLWTLVGDISKSYMEPYALFGIGMGTNVTAILIGSIVGDSIIKLWNSRVLTALLASTTLFLSFLLAHFLERRIESDLEKRLMESTIFKAEEVEPPARQKPGTTIINLENVETLTPRESEILNLLLCGYKNREISERLCISENTLKTHAKRIYEKLGVSSKRELLSIALESVRN